MACSALFRSILLCFLLKYATCQRTPTISDITQEQIKDIGGTVKLKCSVRYAQDHPVLWLKVDTLRTPELLPLSTGHWIITKDSRFTIHYYKASSTYTLQIKDIQEKDSGRYVCMVVITVSNRITADVDLQVRRPPIISDNSTRSLVANEGESAQMECYAGGFPPPKVSWRRENNAILPTGGSIYRGNILNIPSIRKEDRGTYYCVAENGVGKRVRLNINLEVEFAPVVTIPRPILGQNFTQNNDSQEFQNEFSLDSQYSPSFTTESESDYDLQYSPSFTSESDYDLQYSPSFTTESEFDLDLQDTSPFTTEFESDLVSQDTSPFTTEFESDLVSQDTNSFTTDFESSLDSQGSTSSTPRPGLLQTCQTQKRSCLTQRAEEVLNLTENKLSQAEIKTEDEYDIIGKNVANKFRKLPKQMRIITEKFINDMFLQAQIGNLTLESTICTPRSNTKNVADFLKILTNVL